TICCLQDSKGFLWFGTKDGLNRFDGYTFKIFRNNRDDSGSIGNNFIHSLYEDRNNVLWVGTENGLYKYNAGTENFSLLKGTEAGPVRDITMDSSGDIWLISGFTLIKYSGNKSLQYYPTEKYFEATSLCVSKGGTLWVSTADGHLEKHDATSGYFVSYDMFQHMEEQSSKWIEKIYASANNFILVGTGTKGAKIFDTISSTYKDIITYNPDKTGIFVRNFLQVSDSEFWIATESGIFIYNLVTGRIVNLQKNYNDPYSISDNAVYSFYKDKEGGIWACTYFGGVNYYPKQYIAFKKILPVKDKNSLSGNVVREIHEDNNGNLWIGTEDAGLNKLDTATGIFAHFLPTGRKGSISYTNIHGLLVNDNELWIGTFEHGLDIMNIKTGKVIRHYAAGPGDNDLKSNFIYCITKKNNGEIMLGTTIGAYTYNSKKNNFHPLPELPLHNWYTSLLEDGNGVIWAGTYGNGLYFYDTKTNKAGNFIYDPSNANSLSSNRVNCIFEDSNKSLWFATEGGLCSYDKKKNNFKTYDTKSGMPSNFILSILEDDKKNLWVSTSKGLACFTPATEKIITYTTVNGTINDQFNFNAAYKDENGRMYFGSVKGLISFNPNEIKKNTFIPPVYITGFGVFNLDLAIAAKGSALKESILYTNKITLAYDQSTISIGFAALSYTAPEMSEYTYKMEGLDKNWTYLKRNRTAYFTHLSPGTYVFKVKASNSSGIWNEQETTLTIEILPPWWSSSWAYGIYILSGILVLWLLLWNYHMRNEAKNKRKFELLAIEKEKEMFKAKVEFFTNVAHEIRTPLTLIKGPLEKVIKKSADTPDVQNNLKIMERNTNRLIDLTNQLLDFRETEINGFRLNFVNANISELLEETYTGFKSLAEQKNLLFNLIMPPVTLYASIDFDAFNKILNNLFSNAVKYAEKEVCVCLLPFNETDNSFTMHFKNDGYIIPVGMSDKIFEPFFRLKETEKQKGTGIGLALCYSLVLLHKGSIQLKEA
ncbi:MAG: two-component regulator propeller domain-containing protein, partial [Panacibacter sp.]